MVLVVIVSNYYFIRTLVFQL